MAYTGYTTARAPISRHAAFVPLIAAWFAALLGGCIALLPANVVATATAQLPVSASATFAAPAAAAFGGGLGWILAKLFNRFQMDSFERKFRSGAPTDPEVDLGYEPLTNAELETVSPNSETAHEQELLVDSPETNLEGDESQPTDSDGTNCAELEPMEEAMNDEIEHKCSDLDLAQLFVTPPIVATALDTVESGEASLPVEPVEPEALEDVRPISSANERLAHGKAVSLLRAQGTRDLAMPQLIERFAVALDDQRQLAQCNMHSYSLPIPPADLSQRLRALIPARIA